MFYYVVNRLFYLSLFLLKMIFLNYLRVVIYIAGCVPCVWLFKRLENGLSETA